VVHPVCVLTPTDLRVPPAPGLPCALWQSWGARRQQSSGESSREKANVRVHHTLTVIAREGGRSSIPETIVIEPISRGVLDSPPARGM